LFRKVIILFVVLLFPILSTAQAGREKKALKFLEKHRYNSAYVLLRKSLDRDPNNPAAQFLLGQYYTYSDNADYQLDSAYKYTTTALMAWPASSARDRAQWRKRIGLDSISIIHQRKGIEARAFEVVKAENSEEGYNKFLATFPFADDKGAAIRLRDRVAFEKANAENTAVAYEEFLRRYPASEFKAEASEKYESALYNEATKDKSLKAYRAFLKAHPGSPYSKQAQRHVLEIMTADGKAESFRRFIDEYPHSDLIKLASAYLYHIFLEEHRKDLVDELLPEDSLKNLNSQDERILIPFLHKEKFGMMDQEGRIVFDAEYDSLTSEYLCGGIVDDVIAIPGRLVSKNGETIIQGNISEFEDMGFGFVLLKDNGITKLIHKSGFQFSHAVDDARLIRGKMIALKQNGKWGLFTLLGRRLLDSTADEISSIDDVIVMRHDSSFVLSTIQSIASVADGRKARLSDRFDEVKPIMGSNLWVRIGKFQGVLDQNLDILVKVDTHSLAPFFLGAIARDAKGYTTFNDRGEQSEYFHKVVAVQPWLAVKGNSGWMLFDAQHRIAKSISYDSISLHGPFAVGIKKDGLDVHLSRANEMIVTLGHQDRIEFLPGQDSMSYLMVLKDKKSSVYNGKGEKLFTVAFDKIQSAGQGYFIVTSKERKGLLNSSGKLVLPIEYDAIGTAGNGVISILKGMRFGLYDYVRNHLIKPEYEKNVVPYNDKIYTVFKHGFWGFVDKQNKPLSNIEFAEIQRWTDSVALAKSPNGWSLYDVYNRKPILDNIREIKVVRDTPQEKIIILRRNDEMGVISNSKGTIIPLRFSDIVNVGSAEWPVYFTEKHVKEASVFVVIYYNSRGVFLRKEVYEHDDYEKIYCAKQL
jgi:hypothetical protein